MLRDRPATLRRDDAEIVAISALSFLAGQPEALGRFLALTGVGPETLREAGSNPAFLAGVLDFLLEDEALLIAFADDANVPPERIGEARRLLPNDSRDLT